MKKVVKDSALVCIVPRIKDWELLHKEHWYRIPVNKAPKKIHQIKYLAFYQPKSFAKEKYGIHYYAKIKQLEIAKRIELIPDEPCHERAQNEYCKFTIDTLHKLPHPIVSRKRRRIIFITTSLARLMQAREINDLYRTSPLEEKLYKAMKESKIPAERQLFVKESENTYCLDFGIFCKKGKIDVECDGETYHFSKEAQYKDRARNNELISSGWAVLRFHTKEVNQNLPKCINQIKKTIKSLEGLKKR